MVTDSNRRSFANRVPGRDWLGQTGMKKDLIGTYQQVRALLDPVGLKLVKLVQDERRAWWLTFDSGLEVYVGREQFERRLQRLARSIRVYWPPRPSGSRWWICVMSMASPCAGRPDHRIRRRARSIVGEDQDMSRKEDKNLIVGLDIGTSKVVVIVGEVSLDGAIEVVGIGMHPSRGLKKRRGRQHRVDRAVDPARGGRSRTNGGLPDSFGLYRHFR